MYLLNVYSIFKVHEVFALTNQLGTFFDLNEPNLDFFKKFFDNWTCLLYTSDAADEL